MAKCSKGPPNPRPKHCHSREGFQHLDNGPQQLRFLLKFPAPVHVLNSWHMVKTFSVQEWLSPWLMKQKGSFTNVLSFYGRLELNMQLSKECLSIFKCKRNQNIITEEILAVIRISISLLSMLGFAKGEKSWAGSDEQNNKSLITICRTHKHKHVPTGISVIHSTWFIKHLLPNWMLTNKFSWQKHKEQPCWHPKEGSISSRTLAHHPPDVWGNQAGRIHGNHRNILKVLLFISWWDLVRDSYFLFSENTSELNSVVSA